MRLRAPYLGYVDTGGRHDAPQWLGTVDEVISYIKEHLYAEEVVISDSGDRMIFRAVDGVDLYSDLGELGIDLRKIYQEVRQDLVEDEGQGRVEREDWEVYYDSIGLSAGEISMRQRVKRLCKAAQTVGDVIKLLEGTYFDAHFSTEDQQRQWGYFDPDDCSVVNLDDDPGQRGSVHLDRDARVQYISSGEDVHNFFLLDPPEE